MLTRSEILILSHFLVHGDSCSSLCLLLTNKKAFRNPLLHILDSISQRSMLWYLLCQTGKKETGLVC